MEISLYENQHNS